MPNAPYFDSKYVGQNAEKLLSKSCIQVLIIFCQQHIFTSDCISSIKFTLLCPARQVEVLCPVLVFSSSDRAPGGITSDTRSSGLQLTKKASQFCPSCINPGFVPFLVPVLSFFFYSCFCCCFVPGLCSVLPQFCSTRFCAQCDGLDERFLSPVTSATRSSGHHRRYPGITQITSPERLESSHKVGL